MNKEGVSIKRNIHQIPSYPTLMPSLLLNANFSTTTMYVLK